MEANATVPTASPQRNITQSRLESLKRAISGQSFSNFPAILAGFAAKGIPESEIKPRENVFTFEAWKALGRVVRRGEHGVKVVTMIETRSKEIDQDTGEPKIIRRPWTTTSFESKASCAARFDGRAEGNRVRVHLQFDGRPGAAIPEQMPAH